MVDIILSGNFILNDKKQVYLLFRKKHQHYETPGGKVNQKDCKDPNNPTIEELKETAKRELFEEIKGVTKIISMDYFDGREVKIKDGRIAMAHKFITKIEGNPEPNEDIFDKEKSRWIPIEELSKHEISLTIRPILHKLTSLE